ncbi:cytochrome P450 [Streptomyces sp. 150FB]|uniref:cytochrome P450 n=1 Tax=Streptomyces sp. 150FB TaxID=1576605 RepID=UPI0006975BD3|nr:cytochrome P450 [Streptomyces sp. 150FB]
MTDQPPTAETDTENGTGTGTVTEPPTFPSGCPLTYDEEPEPTFPSGCPLTYDEEPAATPGRTAGAGTGSGGGPIRLHGPEFAADNASFYARLRAEGPVVPVEVAPGVRALLVTDYRTALEVLRDTDVWSKDPRVWERDLAPDSPVRPLLEYRATALFVDGEEHRRYRGAIRDSFDRFEPHVLRATVQRTADKLIRRFAAKGEADLMRDFALGLPITLFSELFGLRIESDRLAAIVVGQASVRAGEAQAAYAEFVGAMTATIEAKRAEPGQDLVSYLLAHHADLSPVEVLDELLLTVGVANDPTSGLIGSTLMLMLTDERYSSSLTDGALTVHDAMRVVQWHHSPVGNYAAHYPRRDVTLGGVWIDANSLVMISFGAINSALAPEHPEEAGNGGRAHLGFSAGPHACPAKTPATIVAATAIERLTSFLPTLELTVPTDQLTWREGGFLRSLTSLPVRFTPVNPDQAGATPWTPGPVAAGVR